MIKYIFIQDKPFQYMKYIEGVVAQWCSPLTLKSEQSNGGGSSPSRAPPFACHDKGLRTGLGLLYFCDPSSWH